MPHIIIEHTASIADKVDIAPVLIKLHEALADQGIDKARIKTRAIQLDNPVVGEQGAGGLMAHGTLLLLEGRDEATKKKLGSALHAVMKAEIQSHYPDCAVTLEVRDMDQETYFL